VQSASAHSTYPRTTILFDAIVLCSLAIFVYKTKQGQNEDIQMEKQYCQGCQEGITRLIVAD
jgi:hypothetical protein